MFARERERERKIVYAYTFAYHQVGKADKSIELLRILYLIYFRIFNIRFHCKNLFFLLSFIYYRLRVLLLISSLVYSRARLDRVFSYIYIYTTRRHESFILSGLRHDYVRNCMITRIMADI